MKGYQSFITNLKNSYAFLLKFRIFDLVIVTALLNIAIVLVAIIYIQKIYSINLPTSPLEYINVKSIPGFISGEEIDASASAYVVYDTDSRSVITGKNTSLRFSPASTAKIMSAIVSLEHYDVDQILTVPADIYSVEGSKMHLVPNEKVSVINLLYGMMLPSGNDAAYTLAYNYPSGANGFVKAMNQKAKELKLENTNFRDPDGYDDGNYTTALELSRLAAHAMQNETFRKIVSTRSIEVVNSNNTHTFYLENLNELLIYENVIGIKTGFTNEAGGVLVTAVKKGEKTLIVVVLKSPDRFSDTQDLMEFINSKVEFSQLKSN